MHKENQFSQKLPFAIFLYNNNQEKRFKVVELDKTKIFTF